MARLKIEWPANDGEYRARALDLAIAIGEIPERARIASQQTGHHSTRIRTVQSWLKLKNEPSFEPTIRLMIAAGFLAPLWAERVGDGRSHAVAVDPVERRLAALGRVVGEMVEAQEVLQAHLRETQGQLAQIEAARASRRGSGEGRSRKAARG